MKGRVQTVCQSWNNTKHQGLTEKYEAATMVGQWDRESLDRKSAAVRNWQKGRTRPNPDPKLKAAIDTKTEQFKEIAREAKEAKQKRFCEELSAEKTLTILPTNGREWSYQDNPRPRRRQQVKAKDHRRERSSFTWAIHTTEQPKQLRGNEAYTEWFQQNTCSVAPTMNSHRRNSTKPLGEAARIQHLVWIGFDTRIPRT